MNAFAEMTTAYIEDYCSRIIVRRKFYIAWEQAFHGDNFVNGVCMDILHLCLDVFGRIDVVHIGLRYCIYLFLKEKWASVLVIWQHFYRQSPTPSKFCLQYIPWGLHPNAWRIPHYRLLINLTTSRALQPGPSVQTRTSLQPGLFSLHTIITSRLTWGGTGYLALMGKWYSPVTGGQGSKWQAGQYSSRQWSSELCQWGHQ